MLPWTSVDGENSNHIFRWIINLDSKQTIDLETKYDASKINFLDVVIHQGEGVWLDDVDGNRYLDCLAAYSAVNQGQGQPKILQTDKRS